MGLKVYNTLTGKKEVFEPLHKGKIGMYVCGVTVYDLCHLGHARGAVVFDIIRRYLKYKGYEVTYVRNFTDIDDKIINRAREECCNCRELAARYIQAYREDFGCLGIQDADIEPKATDHMQEMIDLVKVLVEKGFAYEASGDVFFAVKRFRGYGKLSGRSLEQMKAGARIEIDPRKEDPFDFVLWKKSKPGEPSWDSPWGPGRPGWHLECSVMSMKYLGEEFDIHGGGKDLIFPHHENEIAQSEAATGRRFVRYWIHNGFVSINQEKMSKSLQNFFTIRDLLDKYSAETLRFFLLSTHYRSPIDFSDQAIDQAQKALERVYIAFKNIDRLGNSVGESKRGELSVPWKERMDNLKTSFEKAMDDDFNTAEAIGHIFEVVKQINTALMNKDSTVQTATDLRIAKERIMEISSILGLFGKKEAPAFSDDQLVDDLLKVLVDVRQQCRQNKHYSIADMVRERLAGLNIQLEDRSDGITTWRIKGR
ncbi:MAG: cysteine--tRNA ligase [bacterium]